MKEEVPFYQEKIKNPSVKATSTGGATRWRPDFEHKGRRQTKICHT